MPAELSLDHVWITADSHAILLDRPWPGTGAHGERIAVGDLAGQQRFLSAVAAHVEPTSLPLHARGVLRNLDQGKFEKLSFLAGTLRGLLDKPARMTRAIRAGSIFMLPVYVWTTVFLGRYHDKPWNDYLGEIVIISPLVVLGAIALIQIFGFAFGSTASHSIFRLAVVDAKGESANRVTLLKRWAIVWLPLLVPMVLVALLLMNRAEGVASICALAILLLWIGAAVYAVVHPTRGLHDRLAGTWVVRR